MSRNHTLENQLELAIKNSQWKNSEEISKERFQQFYNMFKVSLKTFGNSKSFIKKNIGSTTISILKKIDSKLAELEKIFKNNTDLKNSMQLSKIKEKAKKVTTAISEAIDEASRCFSAQNEKHAIEGLVFSLSDMKDMFDMFKNIQKSQ